MQRVTYGRLKLRGLMGAHRRLWPKAGTPREMTGVLISTATSHDQLVCDADVAVLPMGSFEKHGEHLPLAADTLIAVTVVEPNAADYDLLLLPAIAIGSSYEHADFTDTVTVARLRHHPPYNRPEIVTPSDRGADFIADERRHLRTLHPSSRTTWGCCAPGNTPACHP